MKNKKNKPIIQKIKREDLINDRVMCSGIFKINEDTEEIHLRGVVFKIEPVKILREENSERIFVYKGDKIWVKLSEELYDSAQKVFEVWFEKATEFMIASKKDCPFILINKPMAIVIAPRIEVE